MLHHRCANALPLVLCAPLSSGFAQSASVEPGGQRLSIALDVDGADHGAFLDHLAALRRARDHGGFGAALEAYRASLHQGAEDLVARCATDGALVIGEHWLVPSLEVVGASQALVDELGERARVVSGDGAPAVRMPQSMNKAMNAAHHDGKGANQTLVDGEQVKGQGVTIAVLDTGIELSIPQANRPHRTFYENGNPAIDSGGIKGSRILSADGVLGTGIAPVPPGDDANGHGTRVASMAAGAKYPSIDFGVANAPAPSAPIRAINISNGDPIGLASVCGMVNGFELAASFPDVLVANMSYDGSFGPGQSPNPEIEAVVRSGIVVTLSAGNQGTGSIMHGCYNGIPVGASFLDEKAPYDFGPVFVTAEGPLPDGRDYPAMLAIGESLSAAQLDNELFPIPSYGTSGAAALVAGSAALVRQADPSLTALETKAILLNTSEVLATDPDSSGVGYLQIKDAVDAAIAGEVTSRTTSSLDVAVWTVPLAGGEEFAATVAWERTNLLSAPLSECLFAPDKPLAKPAIADVDVALRDPSGQVVATSLSGVDNVETIRFTAQESGTYSLDVEAVSLEFGTPSVTYAVAGVSGAPAFVQPNLCPASPPVLLTTQDGPLAPSVPGKITRTVMKGCGLDQVQAAFVSGFAAPFTVYSTKAIEVEIPQGLQPASHPVQLDLPGGVTLNSAVVLGESAPILTAPYAVGCQVFGDVVLQRSPGDPYGMVFSFIQGETSVPGLIELDLGGGLLTDVYLLKSGILDVNGEASFLFYETYGLLPGTKVSFQGFVFDVPTLQLVTSNVGTTLIAYPCPELGP